MKHNQQNKLAILLTISKNEWYQGEILHCDWFGLSVHVELIR